MKLFENRNKTIKHVKNNKISCLDSRVQFQESTSNYTLSTPLLHEDHKSRKKHY